MPRSELYVGNLSRECRHKDLERVFGKFGYLLRCDIKVGPSAYSSPYAFVEFERVRDAEDAQRYLNGKEIVGRRVVVEWARSARRGNFSSSMSAGYSGRGDSTCYKCGKRGHYIRDCRASDKGRRRSYSRSRSRTLSRSYSRSRSRSNISRSRSPSQEKRSRSEQRTPSRSPTRSVEKEASHSPEAPERNRENTDENEFTEDNLCTRLVRR